MLSSISSDGNSIVGQLRVNRAAIISRLARLAAVDRHPLFQEELTRVVADYMDVTRRAATQESLLRYLETDSLNRWIVQHTYRREPDRLFTSIGHLESEVLRVNERLREVHRQFRERFSQHRVQLDYHPV